MEEYKIWESDDFFIIKHDSVLPWVKLFTKEPYKEFSHLPKELKTELFDLIEKIELSMIEFYNPDKINIASFGNMLPHMHWHIIARFKDDPYFPKTTWEEPVRDFTLSLKILMNS